MLDRQEQEMFETLQETVLKLGLELLKVAKDVEKIKTMIGDPDWCEQHNMVHIPQAFESITEHAVNLEHKENSDE